MMFQKVRLCWVVGDGSLHEYGVFDMTDADANWVVQKQVEENPDVNFFFTVSSTDVFF